MITVDVQRAGARERDRRSGFSLPPRISARSLAEGLVRPGWSVNFVRRAGGAGFLSEAARRARTSGGPQPNLTAIINSQFDPALG